MALQCLEGFTQLATHVRKRGHVSKQWHFEAVRGRQEERPAALLVATEVANEIQKALKELPVKALMDSEDQAGE